MTESPANEGGAGRKQGRFYKLVGGAVVGLVVAVALLPLLFGGGEGDEPRVVEVEPPLDEGTTGSSAEAGGTASEPASSREDAAGEKWWRSDSRSTSSAGDAESADNEPAAEPSAASSEPVAQKTPSPQPRPAEQEPEAEPAPEKPEPAPGSPSRDGAATEPAQDGAGGGSGSEPSGPGWVVMTGSFQDASNARSLAARLEEQGFQAEVRTARVKGKTWNRVLVGRADSRQGARDLVPQLKEAGYSDLLVMEVQ